ncbi:hypothetical protein C2G38_2217424 [Gigaspora rosea]|uniref:Uncharacterized protein n=1 Tax=Gigaspora rosea TaxID=44941 RepID=A0A397U7Q9_9GLOM|nr:hypothetical protein C2G38_2217424 [Gigaspora rosea]
MKLVIPENDIKWIERNDFLNDSKELVIKKELQPFQTLKEILRMVVIDTREKTNPIPIQDTIRLNQLVKQVVVVGFNRLFNCLLIELDYENIKMTPFLDVTKRKTRPHTIKNNVQRKKVEIELKEEIKILYDNFENAKPVSNNISFSNKQ